MCRLFACAGQLSEQETIASLKAFRRIAKLGVIPPVPNIKRGHTEGWGLVAYKNGEIVYEKKRKAVAFRDPEFLYSLPRLGKRLPDTIIAHVRKMTYGMVASRNNHPFVFGPYSFAHNGSVDGTESIPLKSYFKDNIKGTTDTERFFSYFLQLLYARPKCTTADVQACFKKLIEYIHKHHSYTAINIVLSNSTHVWAYRDYNPENELVKKYNLGSYFTLYYALRRKKTLFVSSEKMVLPGVKWHLLENKHGIEFNIKTHAVKAFDWTSS
ncbi:MAG: class II glutamine amidotransferase [Patescibacteria group bacterium]